jgi:hypothetical protein
MNDILQKCVKSGDINKVKAYFKVIDKIDMKGGYKKKLGEKQRKFLRKILFEQRSEIPL